MKIGAATAIGAIIGALVPATERETKVLGKAGKKLNKKARKMAEAAKDAGKNKVDSLGLNSDAFRDQFFPDGSGVTFWGVDASMGLGGRMSSGRRHSASHGPTMTQVRFAGCARPETPTPEVPQS